MIEKEDVQGYFKLEPGVPKKSVLLVFLFYMLIVCIPTAIFGVYAQITKTVMLPLVFVMSLWIVWLLIKTETKRLQFVLFFGVFCVFISVSFLIAAYKMANMAMRVPTTYVLLTAIAYILTNLICILNTLRLIKKGYFKEKKKTENPMGLYCVAGVFGLSIGKLFFSKTSQDTAVAIVVVGFIIIGFSISIGTHFFVKYYYAKKFQCYN